MPKQSFIWVGVGPGIHLPSQEFSIMIAVNYKHDPIHIVLGNMPMCNDFLLVS